MSFEIVEDAEFEKKDRAYSGGPKGPRARSEEQIPWDDAFEKAWNGNKVFSIMIAPEAAEEAAKRVASSCRLFDLAVTEGKPRPGKAEGTVILSWLIRQPKKLGPRAPKQTDVPEETPAE